MRKLKVAVIGAGLIGMDLVHRIESTQELECVAIIGKPGSRSIRKAEELGYPTFGKGLESELSHHIEFDVVFDASDAESHVHHWSMFEFRREIVFDLTPSHLGEMLIPTVNADAAGIYRRINMISCAGKTSVPIVRSLSKVLAPTYVEVVATAASSTVGPATRRNVDDFIVTTRAALEQFSDVPAIKFMANMSPAKPQPAFQVRISLLHPIVSKDNGLDRLVNDRVREIQQFAPGYSAQLTRSDEGFTEILATVKTTAPDLPECAGNLEIINAAAIETAIRHANLDAVRS